MEEREYTAAEEIAFIKSFNNGYVLQQHEPALLDSILKSLKSNQSPSIEGLREGSKQRLKERELDRIKASIAKGRGNTPQKDRDLEL